MEGAVSTVLWSEAPLVVSEAGPTPPPLVEWGGALVGGLVSWKPAVSSGSGQVSSV